MNIVLIGFRGTGKTTIGKMIAEKLERKFLDTDEIVERDSKMKIAEIFSKFGERKFREFENSAVDYVSKKPFSVISCGGGAILNPKNVENLKKNGFLVLLECNAEKIRERISSGNRPALTEKKSFDEILHLLKIREPFYKNAADLTINTEKSAELVADEIISALQEKGVLDEKS